MLLILDYQKFKESGLDIANVRTIEDNEEAIEERFNKWSLYTQIQLNYIIGDKLAPLNYDLKEVDETYVPDILNILTIRLNRAFSNDQILPRDVSVNYSQAGSLQVSMASDMKDEGWDFWNAQEKRIIEASGLRRAKSICKGEISFEKTQNRRFACSEVKFCQPEIMDAIHSQFGSKNESIKVDFDNFLKKVDFEINEEKLEDKFVASDLSNLVLDEEERFDDKARFPYEMQIAFEHGDPEKPKVELVRFKNLPLNYDGKDVEINTQIPNLGQIKKMIESGGGGDYIKADLTNLKLNSGTTKNSSIAERYFLRNVNGTLFALENTIARVDIEYDIDKATGTAAVSRDWVENKIKPISQPQYLWLTGLKAFSSFDIETIYTSAEEFRDAIFKQMGSRGILEANAWARDKEDSNTTFTGIVRASQNQFRTSFSAHFSTTSAGKKFEFGSIKIYDDLGQTIYSQTNPWKMSIRGFTLYGNLTRVSSQISSGEIAFNFEIEGEKWHLHNYSPVLDNLGGNDFITFRSYIQSFETAIYKNVFVQIPWSDFLEFLINWGKKFDFNLQNGFQNGYIEEPVENEDQESLPYVRYATKNEHHKYESELKIENERYRKKRFWSF